MVYDVSIMQFVIEQLLGEAMPVETCHFFLSTVSLHFKNIMGTVGQFFQIVSLMKEVYCGEDVTLNKMPYKLMC